MLTNLKDKLLSICRWMNENKLFVFMITVFCLLYGFLVLYRHSNFQTHANDLGIYDQAIWLYSKFKLPFSTVRQPNMMLLGDHFHPILLLFVPLYWIWADVRMLLISQVILVVFSVIPLYLITEDRFKNRFFSLSLAFAYLTFFGLQNALNFDFHVATVSVFFLSWLLYFYNCDKSRGFWIFLFLTLICKEDMALVSLMLGLYDFFIKRNYVRGLFIFLISGLIFMLFIKVISPLYSPTPATYIQTVIPGNSLSEQIQYIFMHPLQLGELFFTPISKTQTMNLLLISFLYLPLFSPFFLFLSLPLFLERFLSIHELRWGIGFHYSANIAPLLSLGLVYGINNIFDYLRKKGIRISKKQFFSYISIMIIIISFGITFSEKTFLGWFGNKNFKIDQDRQQNIAEIIKIVPKDASLTAPSALVSHLSHREEIYFYPYGLDVVQYVLVSKEMEAYPYTETESIKEIEKMNLNPDFKLRLQKGETYLFQRIN